MQAIAILGYALLMTSIHRGFAEASLLGNGLAILFILPAGVSARVGSDCALVEFL